MIATTGLVNIALTPLRKHFFCVYPSYYANENYLFLSYEISIELALFSLFLKLYYLNKW